MGQLQHITDNANVDESKLPTVKTVLQVSHRKAERIRDILRQTYVYFDVV